MTEEVKDPEAVLAELRRAQDDLKALRAENKEMKGRLEADDSAQWKNRAVLAEAKAALGASGVKNADKIMKYVDLAGIEFDKDGKLTGLDERLEEVKKDLPALFDVKRQVGNGADIFAENPVNIDKSASARQADLLLRH